MALKQAGMFDPIRSKKPAVLFDGDRLKPSVRKLLIDVIENVTKYPVTKFKKALIIGSMLGYQYNDRSDIDVTLILSEDLDEQVLELKELTKAFNGYKLPGTDHPINIFILRSFRELRPESLTAGYDVTNDEWVKRPSLPTHQERTRFDLEMPYLKLRNSELKRQLRQMVQNPHKEQEAIEVAKEFARLDRARKWAYKHPGNKGGFYSSQNAAFKYSLKDVDEHAIESLFRYLRDKGLTFKE